MNIIQNFRPPTGGESIRVACLNCGYRGSAELAGLPGMISHTLKSNKCPECKKRKLVVDNTVMY